MEIDFDPVKRAKTLAERGLDFLDAPIVFAGGEFTECSFREGVEEERQITYGRLRERWVVMVWTWRGRARRIISMRHAHDEEIENAKLG